MAFADLMKDLDLPKGASDRYRKLEALGRMLNGQLYDDLKHSFDTEKVNGRPHIPLRERRPSVDFNLAYEITQDTLAELFGDEQFPIIHVLKDGKQDEAGTRELAAFVEAVDLQTAIIEAYEEGVVGSVAIVLHKGDDGLPYYDVLPAKFCEPIYRSPYSRQLLALVVTYPIDREIVEEKFPELAKRDEYKADQTFWYRYVVGPMKTVDYEPLPDSLFARLGEKKNDGERIEFLEYEATSHGFNGRTPVVYTRNLGGKGRDLDGMCLWWPIRNICVEIDYTLSQAGRGLRYAADPMLFINKGELDSEYGQPIGDEKPAGGMATTVASDGSMVKGVTQTLVGEGKGADAKLLEISASGITEEREYAADLREYALEVMGGVKTRASHAAGPTTGAAIDKNNRPLRRLVRRQRRPYGFGTLVQVAELTLYGFRTGVFDATMLPYVNVDAIAQPARYVPEWPSEDVLVGQELFYHIEGLQMAAGGSTTQPIELLTPESMGQKLAADVGLNVPYETIKGSLKKAALPGPGVVPP